MLLLTENLTKDYGRHRALEDISLTVGAGEVFGLLGPNGSGKTTALRLLLGFLKPTAGRAAIAGHDCWHDGVAARRQAAYLPGELRLYENMTGRQLIHFLTRLRGRSDGHDLGPLAARFDIDLDRPIAQLSSGMKRKVALLQVLVPKVPLLILDEPTNTLDPSMRDELLEQLRQAKAQGQTVLFSSHVLSEVERVCDRVGILQRGRLVWLQDMHELRQGRRVKAQFPRHPPALPDWLQAESSAAAPSASGVASVPRVSPDNRLDLEYSGPLPPLLEWLAQQSVTDLRMEPLGLAPIYHRFHGPILPSPPLRGRGDGGEGA
jgi:ABC-2 type transport system ATP-binding protein